jgi:hypothetical protein
LFALPLKKGAEDMKRVIVGIIVLFVVEGCSSSSLDAWADRITASTALQQQTTDGLYAGSFKAEALNQKNDIAAAYREIKNAFITKTATQPADQNWLDTSEQFLNARLDASRANEATLRQRQVTTNAGFDDIRNDVTQIKSINAAWWRTDASTSVQLQNMAAQIQALTQKVSGK